MNPGSSAPWESETLQRQSRLILESWRMHFGAGDDLINWDATLADSEICRRLFEAKCVVASHGTESDPILNFGNHTALDLWETDLQTFLTIPSRLTAEPMERTEREEMLTRSRRDGFIKDYRGIRISTNGRRFEIAQAVVWNLVDPDGKPAGQAATFSNWKFIDS